MPGPSATIALPKVPAKSRKIKNDDHVGANAQAIVNIAKRGKVVIAINRRPNSSLSGAHTIGPSHRLLVQSQTIIKMFSLTKYVTYVKVRIIYFVSCRIEYLPTRNIDIGNAFCNWDSTPNSLVIDWMALPVNELPMLLLRTTSIVVRKTNAFFAYGYINIFLVSLRLDGRHTPDQLCGFRVSEAQSKEETSDIFILSWLTSFPDILIRLV